jgi:hypothetical protein
VHYPLLIFAEGTTSNGSQLLELKKGIFVNNTNLLVSIIKYKSDFDVVYDYYGPFPTLMGVLCQWGVDVEVT